MVRTYTPREISALVYKDEIHFSTLLRWCQKGILTPYRYASNTGNRYNKTLFTFADTVMAGIIDTILNCGINYAQLLATEVSFHWNGHNNRSSRELQWKDMGREMQEFMHVHEYRTILEWHTDRERRPIQMYDLDNEGMIKLVNDFLLGDFMAYSGATTFINTRSAWMRVLRKLNAEDFTE